MSSNPAAAKTSASPTLPAVIPTAPASTWRRPTSTHLCVLTCGRSVQVVLGGEALHPVDVALHHVGQHDRRRGVHPVDQAVEYSLKPVHAAPRLGTIRNGGHSWLRIGRAVGWSYTAVQTIWISTGLFSGKLATPMAVRACRPFSPSTSTSSSLAASATSTADRTPACWPRRPASARSGPGPGRRPHPRRQRARSARHDAPAHDRSRGRRPDPRCPGPAAHRPCRAAGPPRRCSSRRPVVHILRALTDGGQVQTERLEPLHGRTAHGVSLSHLFHGSLSAAPSEYQRRLGAPPYRVRCWGRSPDDRLSRGRLRADPYDVERLRAPICLSRCAGTLAGIRTRTRGCGAAVPTWGHAIQRCKAAVSEGAISRASRGGTFDRLHRPRAASCAPSRCQGTDRDALRSRWGIAGHHLHTPHEDARGRGHPGADGHG